MNTLLRLYPGDVFIIFIGGVLLQLTAVILLSGALARLAHRSAAVRHSIFLFDLAQKATPFPPSLVEFGLFQFAWRLEHRLAGLLDSRRNTMISTGLFTRLGLWSAFLTMAILAAGVNFVFAQAEPDGAVNAASSTAGQPTRPSETLAAVLDAKTPINASATAGTDPVLQFPTDRAVGTIQSRPKGNKYETRSEARWSDWSDKVEARGEVRVPADREAWLTINLTVAGDLTFLRKLPPGVPAILTLQSGKLRDSDWDSVLTMTTLTGLELDQVEMNEASLPRIDCLVALRRLGSNQVKLGNALAAAATRLPVLEELQLWSCSGMTDAGMAHVGKITSLKAINLSGDDITDAGFAQLASLTQLEDIVVLNLPAVGDKGAAALAGLTKLRLLGLQQTSIGDAGVAHWGKLGELRRLDLSLSKVGDAGVVHLARLPKLESLSLPGNSEKLTDVSLQAIGGMRSLRRLHVGYSGATDAGVAALAALNELEDLNIGGPHITDAGIAHLAKLTRLKTIWIQNCPVGDDGFSKIAVNPNLEYVLLINTKVTDASLGLLAKLPKLTILTYNPPREVKIRLQPLAGCIGLTALSISGSLTDENELAHLRGMTKLERLDGSFTFGDAGSEHIAALTSLKHLSVWGAGVTDAGLAALASLRNLYYLNLNTRTPTAEARDALRAKLPALVSITAPVGPSPAAKPKVGQAAPPIEATDLDGKPWRLAEQRGKVVLVYFWATWCSPCVASQPGLRDHFAALRKNERFAMVSLSQDYKEFTLRRFVEKTPLPWPQLFIGMDSPIAAAWGTTSSAPHYFLLGPDGKILSTEGDWDQLSTLAIETLKSPATQPDTGRGARD